MQGERSEPTSRSFSFGPFTLVPDRLLLLRDNVPVRIGGRAIDILQVLVEQAGTVVSKRELMARVWPKAVVDDSNLKVNVAVLRRALEDGGPGDPRYIATVVGRGYRFIAPLTVGDPSDIAVTPTVSSARRHNMPTATTRLIGRADVISAIQHDLQLSRLVTIVGAGGIGKTTVALAVAERAMDSFQDGVWFVDLSHFKDPTLVPAAVATAVGVSAHSHDLLAALCTSLQDREMLLLLDSCEHVIEAAAACATQILTRAADVKILVTSREPLLTQGERVRRLPGLAIPNTTSNLTADEALAYPAIQLFVERATDGLESFEFRDSDAPAVAEICRRLDGLALAIEFAATRIGAFGINGLLEQLDDRFRLLVGRRAGPERHRTMTATLDWSYSLLSPREASVLRAVSVFAGGFDINDASAVSGLPVGEAATVLTELVTKSLLAVDIDGDGPAYRLLETTRTYCHERLCAGGEDQEVRQRHAERMLIVLEHATTEWARCPAGQWGATFGRTLDDLRAALAWAGQRHGEETLLIRLTVAGTLLWNHLSLNEECRVHVARALQELDAANLTGSEYEMKLQTSLAGTIVFTRGISPASLECAQRALELASRVGDTDYKLRCLRAMYVHKVFAGEYAAASQHVNKFVAIARSTDPSALLHGQASLGLLEFYAGNLRASRRIIDAAFKPHFEVMNDPRLARFVFDANTSGQNVLANVQWVSGFPETAKSTAERALDACIAMKHDLSLSMILATACCLVALFNRRDDDLAGYLAILDQTLTRKSIDTWRPWSQFYKGVLCARSALPNQGPALMEDAIAQLRASNHKQRMPYLLGAFAEVLGSQGRIAEAAELAEAALETGRLQHEGWCLPELLRIRASILARQGRSDEAEELLLKSISAAERMGALAWQLRGANDLARLWQQRSRDADALALLQPIFDSFREGFEFHDLMVASQLLTRIRPARARRREVMMTYPKGG